MTVSVRNFYGFFLGLRACLKFNFSQFPTGVQCCFCFALYSCLHGGPTRSLQDCGGEGSDAGS